MAESEGGANPFGPGVARVLSGAPVGEAVAPREAATVLVLRDRPAGGIETYMVRRAGRLAFMGGVHVFPGGRVDSTDPHREAAAVREVEEEVGVRLDVRDLRLWARWITPVIEPKRFDAWFFLAALPAGEQAEAVPGEVTDGLWIAPAEAVARAERKEMILAPPTVWNLMELSAFTSVAEALQAAVGREITPFLPRALELEDGVLALLLPADPAYDDPTAPVPVGEQQRFLLDDGRWVVRGAPGTGPRTPG
jgi:8-oxo-dGTP pyrophosphatase MutT (NUDIX family)